MEPRLLIMPSTSRDVVTPSPSRFAERRDCTRNPCCASNMVCKAIQAICCERMTPGADSALRSSTLYSSLCQLRAILCCNETPIVYAACALDTLFVMIPRPTFSVWRQHRTYDYVLLPWRAGTGARHSGPT